MSIDATRSGVASQLANYFSSNYEALLLSSAAQQPVTPLAPQAWLNAVNATGASNANTRFFLRQDGSLQKIAASTTQAQNWTQPANTVEVDANVAYGIENLGLSGTDWLMQRIADEFRLNAYATSSLPLLGQNPEPEVTVDLSSLDTASLVRLLNLLVGRGRDGQRDSAINNAKDLGANAQRLGLSLANLRNALELQTTLGNVPGTTDTVGTLLSGQDNATRDALVSSAVSSIVGGKYSELEAARLAFNTTPAATLDKTQLTRLVRLTVDAAGSSLQGAADIALLNNPYLRQFGSELDYTQTNDGVLVKATTGATREQQVAFVAASLQAALADPALRQNLVDALAANAAALGTDSLPLDQQYALYGQIADGVIAALQNDAAYIEALAAQAVQFRSDIAQLISNEVDASRERDSVPRNV